MGHELVINLTIFFALGAQTHANTTSSSSKIFRKSKEEKFFNTLIRVIGVM